ncbi:hypothetical protein ACE6H2_020929 [Prunus campanulata]
MLYPICMRLLGDVLSSLTSKKDAIPYENSMLTKVLADSLGGSSKTLMIVNVVPNSVNLSETLSSLNFSSRARNAVLGLGNRDTIKKWRDIANDARKELYEKEKESQDLKQESENIMLADKQKIEREQNAQLRNQVAQLLQLEQDQKVQIEQRDSTIQALQVGHASVKSSSFIF